MILQYKHALLTGKPCMIHDGYVSAMDLFCKLLALNGLKYMVTSSYDPNHLSLTESQGAIVVPAKHGNHLVGHATDGNLIDKTGKVWTSELLATYCMHHAEYDPNAPQNDVYQFIKSIRNSGVVRWGGDFAQPDPVHFDDALYIKNPTRWNQIFKELTKPKTSIA